MKKTIHEKRLEKGFTQFEMAVATGISPNSYSNIELNKHIPRVDIFYKICKKLNCKMDDIFLPTKTTKSSKLKLVKPKPRVRKTKKSHSTIGD